MVDLSAISTKLDELTAQVARNESVVASAKAAFVGLLQGQADAIKAALTADNADDQAKIDAVSAVVDPITAKFTAEVDDLASAVPANTPPPAV